MRDFSKVSPTVWRSKKFRALPTRDAKFIYQYLLTCPHGNSAGCFDLHPMYACADLDMTEKEYRDGIESLVSVGLVEIDPAENTVLLVNWLEFNAPANPKHAIGLLSQLDQASSEALKSKVFQELAAIIKTKKFDREAFVRSAIERFFERYGNGIATETRPETETKTERETRPETETKTERETRPDQTKTETREKSRPAPRAVAAEGRDGLAPEERGQGPPKSALLETRLMKATA